jgi:hypothetical protein
MTTVMVLVASMMLVATTLSTPKLEDPIPDKTGTSRAGPHLRCHFRTN